MKAKIIYFLLTIVALAPVPVAAAEPALKLVYAPPFVMPIPVEAPGKAKADEQRPKVQLPLPVTLGPGLIAKEICIEMVGVRFLNVIDAGLIARFEVEPKLAANVSAMPTIGIGVVDPISLRPGEYQLLIRSSKCTAKEILEPLETLVVPLSRSGVKLEALGKVTVDQWLPAPWSDAASAVNPNRLRVRATDETKMTPITELQVAASSFTTSGTGINVGDWALTTSKLPGTPGEAAEVSLAPSGFPVGVASGRVEVRGRDLLAPMAFDLELRTRLVALWIPIVVIAGVVFGWLLRVWLQRRIDLANARKPGFDELQRLQGEVDRIADSDFLEAVGPPLRELRLALDRDDPAAIATTTTQARTAVDTARAKLNEALKDVAQQIEILRADFDVQAPLPEKLAAACAAAALVAADAAKALTARNAAEAHARIAEGERRLGEQLAAAWVEIKPAMEAQLPAFEDLLPLLSTVQRQRMTNAVTMRRTEVNAVATPERHSANALLKAVAQIGRELRAMLDWASRSMLDDAQQRVRQAQARVQNPSDVEAVSVELGKDVDAAAAALQAQLSLDNGFAAPQWGATANTAKQATNRLLKRVLELQTAEVREKVQKLIGEGKPFDEAIEAIPVDDPKLRARAIPELAGRDLSAVERSFADVKRPSLTAPVVDVALRDIAAAAKRNLAKLVVAEFWMALGVGLVLAVVSFAFYQERFVGTWPELLGLFFWGFSADLAADKVATKVKELGVVLKP